METIEKRLQSVWPEWEIVRQIGQGGYGAVYEAVRTDSNLTSRAAIKVISISQNSPEVTTLLSDGMTVEMTHAYMKNVVDGFINEIHLMETFKGTQNIVSVEDYRVTERNDEVGWDIFIRMELLTPLTKYLQQHRMSESEIIKLGVDICKALELCASREVIHRDIKPENIFINDFGDFKLGDFGIARRLEGLADNLSRRGTYSYVAPEVEHGRAYNATADIYSLGLVLYRLLNRNRMPFLTTEQQITSPIERMEATRRRLNGEELPQPMDASPAVAEVVCRACAYEPEDRYPTASAFKDALLAAASDLAAVKKAAPAISAAAAKASASTNNRGSDTVRSTKKKSYQTGKVVALTVSLALVMVGALVSLALAVGRGKIPTVKAPGSSTQEEVSAESSENEEPASHSIASSAITEEPDSAAQVQLPESEDAGEVTSGSVESDDAASSTAASDKAASDSAASSKAASDKAASDAAASKAASDKAASDAAASKAASDKAASEAAAKAASEKAASEEAARAASEKAASDAAAASEAAAKKASADAAVASLRSATSTQQKSALDTVAGNLKGKKASSITESNIKNALKNGGYINNANSISVSRNSGYITVGIDTSNGSNVNAIKLFNIYSVSATDAELANQAGTCNSLLNNIMNTLKQSGVSSAGKYLSAVKADSSAESSDWLIVLEVSAAG